VNGPRFVYYTVSRQVDGENAERIPPGSTEHRHRLVDLLGGHAENRESRGQNGQGDADLARKRLVIPKPASCTAYLLAVPTGARLFALAIVSNDVMSHTTATLLAGKQCHPAGLKWNRIT
jgi:hypothetical protein